MTAYTDVIDVELREWVRDCFVANRLEHDLADIADSADHAELCRVYDDAIGVASSRSEKRRLTREFLARAAELTW